MKNTTWTYKLCKKIPRPPEHFFQQIDIGWKPDIELIKKYHKGNNKKLDDILASAPVRTGLRWNGQIVDAASNRRKTFTHEWKKWVEKNISDKFSDTGVTWCDGGEGKNTTGAHTDGSRNFSLIYVIQPGGPDASLAFWKHKNFPVLWDRHIGFEDSADLINLAVLQGDPGCWYMINAKILHSVENLICNRVTFQISFNHDVFPDLSASHRTYL